MLKGVTNVGGRSPVWEGVPQCGSVCPNVGERSAVLEVVPQCVRV